MDKPPFRPDLFELAFLGVQFPIGGVAGLVRELKRREKRREPVTWRMVLPTMILSGLFAVAIGMATLYWVGIEEYTLVGALSILAGMGATDCLEYMLWVVQLAFAKRMGIDMKEVQQVMASKDLPEDSGNDA